MLCPIIFMKEQFIQHQDINGVLSDPYIEEVRKGYITDYTKKHIIINFLISNITEFCNTFMIRLIEKYIDSKEIAYIIDFTDKFDMKGFLSKTFYSVDLNQELTNIIYSDIIFILNQFIQFYVTTKLIYSKEGVDLYNYLYKDTYEENVSKSVSNQEKFIFCDMIMNSYLQEEAETIKEFSYKIDNELIPTRRG